MVAADAFSQAFTNPLLSRRVFTEATFSPLGWKLVHEPQTLSRLVDRNVPPGRRHAVTMTRPDWVRS
jgi:prostaglandin-endoperoxide synthase 2